MVAWQELHVGDAAGMLSTASNLMGSGALQKLQATTWMQLAYLHPHQSVLCTRSCGRMARRAVPCIQRFNTILRNARAYKLYGLLCSQTAKQR